MAIESPQDNLYPIVNTVLPYSSQTLSPGTIAYWQNGTFGTPLGLLLSLTLTPALVKVIQTSTNGLRRVNL